MSTVAFPQSPQSPAERAAVQEVDDLAPTGCTKCMSVFQDVITVSGAAGFGVTAVYLGLTGAAIPFTVAAGVTSVAFLTLFIVDKTCGRSTAMNAVISRALSQTAAQQNQQRSIILREQQAVDRGIELNRMEIPNLTAAAAINKAGVEDTTKLKATVTDLQKQITGLVSANQGLQSDLKSTTEQNIELKTQLTKFTTLLTQFHDEVQQVSESIPELQKVDMNISASVDEFKESAEKVTSGFSQILAQLTTHATTIDSLTSKKEQLEKQLSELQALVVSLGSSKAAIEIENIELKGTNERLDAINQSFVKLTAKLEADRVDLEARKRQFEEQYGKWGDHLGKLSIVTQKLEQAASSSHSQGVDAYLQQNSEDIKAQLAKLKQDEEV